MEFTFLNVNDAFGCMVDLFQRRSKAVKQRNSRNGPVLMIDEPCMVTYTHPQERVLFNSARDCNPFFHLFESLWMLAGRNDISSLKYYVSTIGDYSDDGTTFHGAYGHRWRHWFGYDQLLDIVGQLQKDPNSRRVVLQMWDNKRTCLDEEQESRSDSYMAANGGKDVPCLAGEVKFRSPEGDTSIRKLAEKFQSEGVFRFPVYAVDTVSGDQRLCWMTNAWKSGVKKVYRICFDDGSSIRLTCDHLLFRKQKRFEGNRCIGLSIEKCLVGDLRVGDRVLAAMPENARSRNSPKGYRLFKRNIYKNTSFDNRVLEHREYLRLVYGVQVSKQLGMSCHHINDDKCDNRLINLEYLEDAEHFAMGKRGQDNPHCKMSVDAKTERGRKHSESLTAYWASMSKETRKAFAQRRNLRTPEQWVLIEKYKSSKSNHKITRIEPDGMVPVYDFTVIGRHNAVLSNGVVCHNCNTHAYFSIREKQVTLLRPGLSDQGESNPCRFLDMTVCNRSNDLIWGMLGANVVHFSILQEYLAACIGVEVGYYHQFTNNLHTYTSRWKGEEWLKASQDSSFLRPIPLRLVRDPQVFDIEYKRIVDKTDGDFDEPFLRGTVQPMLSAFRKHKQRQYLGDQGAFELIERVEAPDWRYVGKQWMQKRYNAWTEKIHVI